MCNGGLTYDKAVSRSSLRKEFGFMHFDFDSFGPGKIKVRRYADYHRLARHTNVPVRVRIVIFMGILPHARG
jgi:hypothetical protein